MSESFGTVAWSRESLEQRILELLASESGCTAAQIDPDASFADLGLDSFTAVAIATALSEMLGRELPDTILFDFPTPSALAGHLVGT
jgi:acyl carrier protein